jgi:signal transduction histidine kinase/DNA-binding response OmpR family regulator
MKSLAFGSRYFLLAVALVVMAGLVLPLGSCQRHSRVHSQIRDDHYIELDIILARIQNLDSMAAMVTRYHDQGDAVGEMLALKYQGGMMRNQSLFRDAIEQHTRGLEIAKGLADTLEMAMALNNIAINYRRLGELSMANNYHFQALKLCDTYSDRECDAALKSRAVTLNGIGNIEIQLHNYSVADSLLREALDVEQQLNNNQGIAFNYASLGRIKYGLNDIDSAWVYYRNSLEYCKLAGDDVGTAWCHLSFGVLHESERRYSHAEKEYRLAYDELSRLGETWFWLESCLALAHVSIKLGEEEDAHNYLSEAEAEIRRINSKEHQAEAYKIRSELALVEGKQDEAFTYFVKSDELYDSIRGMSMDEEMRAQRINYERERNSGEVNELNNNIVRLKRLRNIMIVLGVLLLLLAAAIITSLVYAIRLRANSQRVLRQVEETRSLFFTNVVHQLRTPMTAIMGAIDGISIEARKQGYEHYTDTQRENIEVIERQGENLLKLVDQILEVGSVRSAIRGPEWRTGDAVPLIRMMVESYREQCIERHIELSYSSREASVEIDTIPDYLKTIVGNLIQNAINYSRDFSKITIISRLDGDKFIIRVADDGMGISKEDLPHVFEPFYRGAAAERIVDGVGIGLTVVRDMVMVMGGSVAADSMKGQGSVFTVILPSKHQTNEVKSRFDQVMKPINVLKTKLRRTEVIQPGSPVADAGKPVILVVEDHNDVARLVGKVFEDKYVVHYAADGEQGLSLANELTPNLIITDVKMPVMDGCELCRKIRSSKELSHIPVIMLSARNSKEDRIRGVKAGADAYMVKPFVREELEAWVERLLENRRLLLLHEDETLHHVVQENEDVTSAVAADANFISDEDFLKQFNELVEKELDEGYRKLDLDAIAMSFKMGESQLRRKIQALTGKNMTAYTTQLRMEKAMRLLRSNPNILIGDVADQCGFVDVAYFSRVFRQHYSMTPTQARNGEVSE